MMWDWLHSIINYKNFALKPTCILKFGVLNQPLQNQSSHKIISYLVVHYHLTINLWLLDQENCHKLKSGNYQVENSLAKQLS